MFELDKWMEEFIREETIKEEVIVVADHLSFLMNGIEKNEFSAKDSHEVICNYLSNIASSVGLEKNTNREFLITLQKFFLSLAIDVHDPKSLWGAYQIFTHPYMKTNIFPEGTVISEKIALIRVSLEGLVNGLDDHIYENVKYDAAFYYARILRKDDAKEEAEGLENLAYEKYPELRYVKLIDDIQNDKDTVAKKFYVWCINRLILEKFPFGSKEYDHVHDKIMNVMSSYLPCLDNNPSKEIDQIIIRMISARENVVNDLLQEQAFIENKRSDIYQISIMLEGMGKLRFNANPALVDLYKSMHQIKEKEIHRIKNETFKVGSLEYFDRSFILELLGGLDKLSKDLSSALKNLNSLFLKRKVLEKCTVHDLIEEINNLYSDIKAFDSGKTEELVNKKQEVFSKAKQEISRSTAYHFFLGQGVLNKNMVEQYQSMFDSFYQIANIVISEIKSRKAVEEVKKLAEKVKSIEEEITLMEKEDTNKEYVEMDLKFLVKRKEEYLDEILSKIQDYENNEEKISSIPSILHKLLEVINLPMKKLSDVEFLLGRFLKIVKKEMTATGKKESEMPKDFFQKILDCVPFPMKDALTKSSENIRLRTNSVWFFKVPDLTVAAEVNNEIAISPEEITHEKNSDEVLLGFP